jgi:hypothetical protein
VAGKHRGGVVLYFVVVKCEQPRQGVRVHNISRHGVNRFHPHVHEGEFVEKHVSTVAACGVYALCGLQGVQAGFARTRGVLRLGGEE